MKLLFAMARAALDGTTAQLAARVRKLESMPHLEIEAVALEDRGLPDRDQFRSLELVDPWRFRELVAAKSHDAVVVVEAPAYLDAIADLSVEQCLLVEVRSTRSDALAYLRDRKPACDSFIVPSRFAKRTLEEVIGPYRPIEIAPTSVDPRLFHPTPGPPHVRPIVGWVGRLEREEDWKRFLLIASMLAEGGANVELWMAGGETVSDSTVEAFLDSADALDLSPSLRWFPRIEHAAMRRYYSAIAASGGCLLTSSTTAMAEALLCSCPVVAPDEGAAGEVAPGAGYLSLFGRPEEASAQVMRALGFTGATARLTTDLADLRQRFTPQVLAPAYLAMVVRMLELRRMRA